MKEQKKETSIGVTVTLRDYFASESIPDCISNGEMSFRNKVKQFLGMDYNASTPRPSSIAENAYKIADAMIEERNKTVKSKEEKK